MSQRGEPQKDIFLKGEGDNWFSRNQNSEDIKNAEDLRFIIQTLGQERQNNQINSILEIGCGEGLKLEYLCDFFDSKGVGIDPSQKAIETSKLRNKNKIEYFRGTADRLPIDLQPFDLVVAGFFLYLVDRSLLFRCLSEIDSAVKPGGFLAILDFDFGVPVKNVYHHDSRLFSYKNNYADILVASHHYSLVGKKSFSHLSNSFDFNRNERISIQILYKEPEAYFDNQSH